MKTTILSANAMETRKWKLTNFVPSRTDVVVCLVLLAAVFVIARIALCVVGHRVVRTRSIMSEDSPSVISIVHWIVGEARWWAESTAHAPTETSTATEAMSVHAWRFISSDMLCCVVGWAVPDVSEDPIAFVFRATSKRRDTFAKTHHHFPEV